MSVSRKSLLIFLIITISNLGIFTNNVEAQTTLSALEKLQLMLGITTTPATTPTTTTTVITTTTKSPLSALIASLLAKLNITTTTSTTPTTTTTTTLTTTTIPQASTTKLSISDMIAALIIRLGITTTLSTSTLSSTISSSTTVPTTSSTTTPQPPSTTSSTSTTVPTTSSTSTIEPTTTSSTTTTETPATSSTSTTVVPTTSSTSTFEPTTTTSSTTTTEPSTTSSTSTTETPTTSSTTTPEPTTTSSTTTPEPTIETSSSSSTSTQESANLTQSINGSSTTESSTTPEILTGPFPSFPTNSPNLPPTANLTICDSSTSIYDSFSNFLRGACIVTEPLNFPGAEEFCKRNNFAGLFSVTRDEEWNSLQRFLVDYSMLAFGFDFINNLNFHIFGNLNVNGVWKFPDGNLLFSPAIPSIGQGSCLNAFGSGMNQVSTSQSACDDSRMFVCEFGVATHPPAIYLMPTLIPADACQNLEYCRYFTDSNFDVNCVLDYFDPIAPVTDPFYISSMNAQVKKVFYKNCKMINFPSNVFVDFPGIEMLSVSNTSLSDPFVGDVGNCGNLKILDLSYNPEISQLSSEVYGGCSNLEIVDVTGCSVNEVRGSFVRALSKLLYVIVGKN